MQKEIKTILPPNRLGWSKVIYTDGSTGYIKITQQQYLGL